MIDIRHIGQDGPDAATSAPAWSSDLAARFRAAGVDPMIARIWVTEALPAHTEETRLRLRDMRLTMMERLRRFEDGEG